MKKLIFKITILIMLALSIFVLMDALSLYEPTKNKTASLTNSKDFINDGSGNSSIGPLIESLRLNDGANTLVLGDSIAGQMFRDFENIEPTLDVKCANAAINISGQYMLACEYLKYHPETTDIWLYMHPMTLTRTYDVDLGYGYSVLPFALSGLLDYLEKGTRRQMSSVYGVYALNPHFTKVVEYSPLNRKLFLTYVRMNKVPYKQDNQYEIASLYIKKFKELCEENNVTFHFYSSPSTEYYRNKIKETSEDFFKSDLSKMYPDYLDSIYYFPTEWSEDMTHFAGKYNSREYYDKVIEEAYDDFFCKIPSSIN